MLKNDLSWLELEVLVPKLPLSGEKIRCLLVLRFSYNLTKLELLIMGFSVGREILLSHSLTLSFILTHIHIYTHFS